jgi:hypothetical protein
MLYSRCAERAVLVQFLLRIRVRWGWNAMRIPVAGRWLLGIFGPIVLVLGSLGALVTAQPALAILSFATSAAFQPCMSASPTDAAPNDSSGQFTLHPLYTETLAYTLDIQGRPVSSRSDRWTYDVENGDPILEYLFTSIRNAQDWQATLTGTTPDAFRCAVEDAQAQDITGQVLSALQVDAALLSGPPTDVYLMPFPTRDVGGVSTTKAILIPFWEPNPADRSLLRDYSRIWGFVPFAVAHEYFEVVRYDHIGEGRAYETILDNIVTDGMAEAFGSHQTGQDSPSDTAMTVDVEEQVWGRIQSSLDAVGSPLQDSVMFGDASQGIPTDAGYCIGFHIVRDFLRIHPTATFAQLAGMSAKAVLAGSGYIGSG